MHTKLDALVKRFQRIFDLSWVCMLCVDRAIKQLMKVYVYIGVLFVNTGHVVA